MTVQWFTAKGAGKLPRAAFGSASCRGQTWTC